MLITDEIAELASANPVTFNLLEGCMGLCLVGGIAALGVVAARAVVERRQQIGVLRAIGFQKGQEQLSFLPESSFVTLLGIAIGFALGFSVSRNVVDGMAEAFQDVQYTAPWMELLVVPVLAYGASLLTTFLHACQASKVYPVEAPRSE